MAAAAAVELKNLAEEVTKLSYQNAKLTSDLAAAKELVLPRYTTLDGKQDHSNSVRPDACLRNSENGVSIDKLQKELLARCQREASLEAALSEKDQREVELQKRMEVAKRHEEDLENELSNMWVLVAKMRKTGIISEQSSFEERNTFNISQTEVRNGFCSSNSRTNRKFKEGELSVDREDSSTLEELRACYEDERRRCKELEDVISKLKVYNTQAPN